MTNKMIRILTINWHTSYLYLLSKTGHLFYIMGEWEESSRPIPDNCILIKKDNYSEFVDDIDLLIGHNIISDFFYYFPRCLRWQVPYIQVIHGHKNRTGFKKTKFKIYLKHLYALSVLGTFQAFNRLRVIFIAQYDALSWPVSGHVIPHGIPIEDMADYDGTVREMLVVGNRLDREHFQIDNLLALMNKIPIQVVGENPNLPESHPAHNWEELLDYYSKFRAFVNIAGEPERGYNLSMLEAMATGMPVVSVYHPNSPIRDGWSGFLVRTTEEMEARCRQLLDDHALAKQLGANARETVKQHFNIQDFVNRWNQYLYEIVNKKR